MTKKLKSKYVLSLDLSEQARYDAFVDYHYSKHKFKGGVPVTLTPTGIGVHVLVKCPKCKKSSDITNYNNW